MKLFRTSAIIATMLVTLTACGEKEEAKTTTEPTSNTSTSETKPMAEEAKSNETKSTSDESKSSNKLETKFVTIATGGASGPYNIIATTLADEYNKAYGVNSKTQTTGASIENANLVENGKVEMAFLMSDIVSDAVKGENSFKAPVKNINQMAVLYPNFVQVVTSKDSGIETLADIEGKRVSVGAPGSGTEVNARNLIQGFGMTYDDIKVDYLGYAESADALKTGKVDVAFLTSGLPNASLLELSKSFPLKLVSIPPEKLKEIADKAPYFSSMEVPTGTYGIDKPVTTAVIRNAIIVSSKLSEDDVYKLTKTFIEKLPALQNSHQAIKAVDAKSAQEGMVAPIHPGAKKYYDELNSKK
ncbi:TAXI family TRAP transporter solute-binding subunit [Taylorella equigenitalis]|uniref:TAXI family TRAP transporter solute-binding subunit n=1 Tax=Taylorella equigenitalis TaxID=29575 RepID=UPI00042A8E75|nr:TAXI family TRAP transporter solute-binding subunit [Taylorella equigenitalis]WDU53897.1 TAXI family TRAP transporter solute-binding subunit [Taylorella equigenitalis]